jgi:hypothetical protein
MYENLNAVYHVTFVLFDVFASGACCIDAARIAIVQTQTKLAYQDPKRNKKVVYEAVKNCIVKVTKKGSYKKLSTLETGPTRCDVARPLSIALTVSITLGLIAYMKKKVCNRAYFFYQSRSN